MPLLSDIKNIKDRDPIVVFGGSSISSHWTLKLGCYNETYTKNTSAGVYYDLFFELPVKPYPSYCKITQPIQKYEPEDWIKEIIEKINTLSSTKSSNVTKEQVLGKVLGKIDWTDRYEVNIYLRKVIKKYPSKIYSKLKYIKNLCRTPR